MKVIFYLPLLASVVFGFPQYVIDSVYNDPSDSTVFEIGPDEGDYIDPGLLDENIPQIGLGLEEEPNEGSVIDENYAGEVPDILIVDEPVEDHRGPFDPDFIYRRPRPNYWNPFERNPMFDMRFEIGSNGNEERQDEVPRFEHPPRRSQRPSIFDMFTRDFFRPHRDHPMFEPFPLFHRQRPVFSMGNFPQEFPSNSDIPLENPIDSDILRDSNIPEDTLISENSGSEANIGFEDFQPDVAPEEKPRHPFNPFLHHFFRPSFNFGSSSFDNFPSNLPDNYNNSTYKIEDINGTKVAVNETIQKKSGDNFNTFFHFKIIRRVPQQEEAEDMTQSPLEFIPEENQPQPEGELPQEEVVPQEEIFPQGGLLPEEGILTRSGGNFNRDDESFVDNTDAPREEILTTVAPEDADDLWLNSFDFGKENENEIFNDVNRISEPTV